MAKRTKDERLDAVNAQIAVLNKSTGQDWKIIYGNPHVNCLYLLVDGKSGNNSILCESNMLGLIEEFLRGVQVGLGIAAKNATSKL